MDSCCHTEAPQDERPTISLVVVGHVDAGRSRQLYPRPMTDSALLFRECFTFRESLVTAHVQKVQVKRGSGVDPNEVLQPSTCSIFFDF